MSAGPQSAARHPELQLLEAVFGTPLAVRITTAAGDWRTLTVHEMVSIGLDEEEARGVTALQALAQRNYAPAGPMLGRSDDVGRVYGDRLAGLEHEVILAIALDGRNRVIHEIEIGRGGLHGAAVKPADVFRPLIRAGASAFILVHNHPSGDPSPSPEDIRMTQAVATLGTVVSLPMLDHVIVGGRGGGYSSMCDLGVLEGVDHGDEEGSADQAVRA